MCQAYENKPARLSVKGLFGQVRWEPICKTFQKIRLSIPGKIASMRTDMQSIYLLESGSCNDDRATQLPRKPSWLDC